MFKRSVLGLGSAAAVIAAPLIVLAPQAGYAQQVEEIVVSVRRKDESLQEVPIAVSTIGEDQIRRFGINSTQDVVKYSAGLEFDEGLGAQDTRIVIRGLSPTRGRSNVAILVDGIDYTGEAVGTAGGGILVNQQLLDVQRVEVVKGPQSALYGRSAFAGAIQYVSKKPSLEAAEGSLDVQIGNGNNADGFRVSAAYGGPITDSFGLRVNGLAYDQEGYYRAALTGETVGGSQGAGIALSGIWDAGGAFSATGRVAYSSDKYDPQAQSRILANTSVDVNDSVAVRTGQTQNLLFTNGPGFIGGLPDCGGPGDLAAPRNFAVASCAATPKTLVVGEMPDANGLQVIQREDPRTGGNYEGTKVDTITANIVLNWDVGVGTISSYTGYAALDSSQLFDGQTDALPAGSYTNFNQDYSFTLAPCGFADCSPTGQELDFNNQTRLYSQELRFATNFDAPVNFTVGGLVWAERVDQVEGSRSITPAIFRRSGFPPNQPPDPPVESEPPANLNINNVFILDNARIKRDTTSYSLYGLIDWQINDSLNLQFEGRWVREKLEVGGSILDSATTEALTGLDAAAQANAFRGASSVGIANGAGILPNGTYTLAAFGFLNDEFEDDFFAPKATLQWMPTDDQMFYTSIAKGIKPGGISTITAGAFFNPSENTFQKEKLLVYEIGSKSTLFDGSVILNTALFFQDYTDKQVGVTRFDQASQIEVGGIENAGEAETYGIELEALWQVTENLSLSGAYSWLESEYTQFEIETQATNNIARNLAAGGGGCLNITPGFTPDQPGICTVDLTGNAIEDVPKHSFVGNARWQAPVGNSAMEWYADASFIFKDKRFIDEFNAKELRAYWLMDFRAGLVADQWEAIFFVDNLFDDDTVKSAVDFGSLVDATRQGFFPPSPPDGVIVSLPDPRVVGLRLNYKFGAY